MPDGYGAPFAHIGICTTLGSRKTAAVAGILAGAGTAAFVYVTTGLPRKFDEEEVPAMTRNKRIIAALTSGVLVGGLSAAVGYFYCRGVEVGVPLAVRER